MLFMSPYLSLRGSPPQADDRSNLFLQKMFTIAWFLNDRLLQSL